MSLILEALRKSEQQRRLGEVPTLGSESAWAMRRWHGTPVRGARWPWFAAITVLALAGAAGWWFLGQRGDSAAGADGRNTAQETPAATSVDAAAPSGPAEPAPPPPQQAPTEVLSANEAPTSLPTPSPQPIEPPATPPAAPAAVVPSSAALPPLEAPTPAVDGEYPVGPAPAESIAPPAAAPMPTPVPQAAPPPVEAAPPTPAPAAAEPAPIAPEPSVAAPSPSATAPGDVPLVYALPLATRQTLPPLKLSMHVWNADPTRRFVIVGETRAAEGESAGTDLSVVEIRREGVVLEFKGTRFLLPRGGW